MDRVKVIIELPWPDPKLHAHAKGHWRGKVNPTSTARAYCGLLCKQVTDRMQSASIRYRFYAPDNLRRDAANLVQACKPYVDGIVDAGIIPDDSWQFLRLAGVEVEIDKKRPRVVLELTEESNERAA